jgi:aspartyl-tRNA(Asn)/glutamyl-tRNA(Gln) amidotransferase subunit B
LPAQIRSRLESTYGIGPYDSDVIVNQGRAVVDYYIELADGCGDGKVAGNWVQQDVLRTLNERGIGIHEFPVSANALAQLIAKVTAGQIETSRAREVLAEMIASGKSADETIRAMGIQQVDETELIALGRELLQSNAKVLADLKAGNLKAAGWLIGQAKRKNPNVNPGRFREICVELAKEMV